MQLTILNRFKTFRDKIFDCFSFRADATMELVDALSGNTDANSVVQLSMNPAFRRKYGSVRDAITNFEVDPKQSHRIEGFLIKHCSPITETRPFRLMVLDCTPAPRKHAKTLKDRGIVHAPNVIPGNKPITVGHQYAYSALIGSANPFLVNQPIRSLDHYLDPLRKFVFSQFKVIQFQSNLWILWSH